MPPRRTAIKSNDTSFDMSGMGSAEANAVPIAPPPARPPPPPYNEREVEELVSEAMPDVIEEKRKLLLMLGRYRTSRFGKYLQDMNYKLQDSIISKLSLDELQKLLKDVQFTIANKNNQNMLEPMVLGGVSFIEKMVSDFYDVRGLSANLAQDQAFLEILEEIQLKSLVFSNNDPETRLAITVLKAAYVQNRVNELRKRVEAQQQQPTLPHGAPSEEQFVEVPAPGGFVPPEDIRDKKAKNVAA